MWSPVLSGSKATLPKSVKLPAPPGITVEKSATLIGFGSGSRNDRVARNFDINAFEGARCPCPAADKGQVAAFRSSIHRHAAEKLKIGAGARHRGLRIGHFDRVAGNDGISWNELIHPLLAAAAAADKRHVLAAHGRAADKAGEIARAAGNGGIQVGNFNLRRARSLLWHEQVNSHAGLPLPLPMNATFPPLVAGAVSAKLVKLPVPRGNGCVQVGNFNLRRAGIMFGGMGVA